MSYHRRHATTAEIQEYANSVQAQFPSMKVRPNGYGLRVECPKCHEAGILHPERFARTHTC